MTMQDEHSDLCPHFGECGGCAAQDVAYAEQLSRKQRALRDLFGAHWNKPIAIEPSPTLWHYRNRLDFNFGRRFYPEPPPKDFVRETVLGFRRKGRWSHLLDIHECRIGPEGTDRLLTAVRAWAARCGLHGFDSRTHQGLLKILLVREGKRTGQRMLVLITGEETSERFDRSSFVDVVQSVFPVESIHHAVSLSPSGVSFAEHSEILHGSASIEEQLHIADGSDLRVLRFRVSPFSFFQTNTLGTERLYTAIREWVRALAPQTIYDLYGGSGGIALACADCAEHIISVESIEAASADGRHNAALNGVQTIEFVSQKVEEFLRRLTGEHGRLEENSVVILDPPRAGLHPKAIKALLELRPRAIIYLSCKPQVLAQQELPHLLEAYHLEKLHAFDLFPHTPHVELAAEFSAIQAP